IGGLSEGNAVDDAAGIGEHFPEGLAGAGRRVLVERRLPALVADLEAEAARLGRRLEPAVELLVPPAVPHRVHLAGVLEIALDHRILLFAGWVERAPLKPLSPCGRG